MRCILFSILLACSFAFANDEPVDLIAFGSCAKQNKPQPILDYVTAAKPDMFIYLGDNIYGDTVDMDNLRASYQALAALPEYQRMKAATRILATWDDHDFGADDAGREYPKKEDSKKVFLEFFEEPADSPRWKHEGIYTSYVFGPEGKRVQIILLDLRTFRSPLEKTEQQPARPHAGPYIPMADESAVMLGEEQWAWLEEQLKVPAEIRLVGSSVQFAAEFHGWESWANFPKERERFIDLMNTTRANGVVFLSGDMHYGELSIMRDVLPYPLLDVTSSGINQVWAHEMENIHRFGSTEYREHIGWIAIDWNQPDPLITFRLQVVSGETGLYHTIRLSTITGY